MYLISGLDIVEKIFLHLYGIMHFTLSEFLYYFRFSWVPMVNYGYFQKSNFCGV